MLLCGGQECPELRDGPYGARFLGLGAWPLGPFHRVTADELLHDDGIAECLPEHRVQVGYSGHGERLAVAASAGQQVPVQLGDSGRPDGLDRQVPDARRGVEPDAGPVVGQVRGLISIA